MRKAFSAFVVLCGAGAWLSLHLIEKHVAGKFGLGADTGICSAYDFFSCDAVVHSPYSELAGVPIAALGGAFYLTMLVLAGLTRFAGQGFSRGWDVFVAAGVGGVLYSAFLAVVSMATLGKICPYCMGLYAVNTGLLVAALLAHPDPWRTALGRLVKLPVRFETWFAAGLMALLTFGAQHLYASKANAAVAAKRAQAPKGPGRPDGRVPEVPVDDLKPRGPADAKVTVVEFSDFQCPFCQRLADALEVAAKEHGNVRVFFRHNPMDQACNPQIQRAFHEHACDAARAMVCAESQGKQWEMHDRLFANNQNLARPDLLKYAAELGIDAAVFELCLDAPDTSARIKRDLEVAGQLGVEGTPTFFVNGFRYVGAKSPEELVQIFKQAESAAAGTTAGKP